MNTGNMLAIATEILIERARQIAELGYTPDKDDERVGKELAVGAAHLALTHTYCGKNPVTHVHQIGWPWGPPQGEGSSHRTNCLRAAAMLVAEVERIDRLGYQEVPVNVTITEGPLHPIADQNMSGRLVADTHGSRELGKDAAKLRALGQDPGPTLGDLGPQFEIVLVKSSAVDNYAVLVSDKYQTRRRVMYITGTDAASDMGADNKAYFNATWSTTRGWTLGERVPDQDW